MQASRGIPFLGLKSGQQIGWVTLPKCDYHGWLLRIRLHSGADVMLAESVCQECRERDLFLTNESRGG